MTQLDVWTVSITLRTERGRTQASAFLQSPVMDLECEACANPSVREARTADSSEELAAAHALAKLSRRLVDLAMGDGR